MTETRRGRRNLLLATGVVVLLLGLDAISGGVVRAQVRAIGSMAWRQFSAVGSAVQRSGFFASKASLERENKLLTQQVVSLQGKAALASADETRIASLEQVAHLVGAQSDRAGGLTAPVISNMDSSPYGTFLIGAGSADGLKAGDIVRAPDGYVVGTLANVASHQSLVIEVFAPQTKRDVLINAAPVLLQGRGGGNAQGDVPDGSLIAEGAVATSPEFHQLPVGIVGRVEKDSGSASSVVYVRVPDDLATLSFVYVEQQVQ